MPHSVTLITTIAASLALALVLGLVANRLRLPAIVGYLIAGISIGPATPGFVADVGLSGQLAEIGVILLMFGVGLHFSLEDLLAVRRIALPGAVVQIVAATLMGVGVAKLWGWPLGGSIIFGLGLSVASTVVLLKSLEQRGILQTINGQIAVGWLIVEDLAMVLVLVLLPPLAGWLGGTAAGHGDASASIGRALLVSLAKISVFIALMLAVGRRVFPWLLGYVARTGSRELFTLTVIAVAVGIAYGSARLFGVSFALGAFFAGMVMRESDLSHRAAEESLPLRDAFSVLFFVSVGMLFDPAVLVQYPLRLLAVVAIIVVGKSAAAFLIVLVFRYPLNTALTVSASLAQIGEFSFILAGLGVSMGIMPATGQSLILAGALVSISINHLVFAAVEPAQRWISGRSRLARFLERPSDPLAELPEAVESRQVTGHVVIVGYGRVGRRIGEALAAERVPFVVAEENREAVEKLRAAGTHAVAGDATDPMVLAQAHVVRASLLVVAIADALKAQRIVDLSRRLNPKIQPVLRTHSDDGEAFLRQKSLGAVFHGENELARSMARFVLEKIGRAAAVTPRG